MITSPMLAATLLDVDSLRYPVLVSPKLDGIRALRVGGRLLSRKFKLIPNQYIRETLENILPDGADGEILVGSTFQNVSSAVMSHEGTPVFAYNMFDLVKQDLRVPFLDRYVAMLKTLNWTSRVSWTGWAKSVVPVVHAEIANSDELLVYEADALEAGYEGVMIRSLDGPYKCGRSTLREGYLLKLKRFIDREAEILEVFEMQENTNEATVDELGHTKRSSHKAGKVGKGLLGGFRVRDLVTGCEFYVGTMRGFTQEDRRDMWEHQDELVGKILKYKSQPVGVKEAPRFPVALGIRHLDDM